MQNFGPSISHFGIENHGIKNAGTVYWNLTTPMLYEQVAQRREGVVGHLGPLLVRTGVQMAPAPRLVAVSRTICSPELAGTSNAKRPPDCLIVVNSAEPYDWKSANRPLYPLIGDVITLARIAGTLYNKAGVDTLRVLDATFLSTPGSGAVVSIASISCVSSNMDIMWDLANGFVGWISAEGA